MKRQSFWTIILTKMKLKPLFLDLCQSKKRKKGYNLEVLTGRRRGSDRKTCSLDRKTWRHEFFVDGKLWNKPRRLWRLADTIFAFLMLNTMSSAHNKIIGAKFSSFERFELIRLCTVGYVIFWRSVMKSDSQKSRFLRKRVRDAAFFLIIMLVTFAATLLKPQNYVSSRTIWKCVEHVSTST